MWWLPIVYTMAHISSMLWSFVQANGLSLVVLGSSVSVNRGLHDVAVWPGAHDR